MRVRDAQGDGRSFFAAVELFLDRPNGVVVADSLLLVVEWDNHRVQVFRLPGLEPLGSFGADRLTLPYGVTLYRNSTGGYEVYVTDNPDLPVDSTAAQALNRRIHHWRLRLDAGASRSSPSDLRRRDR